MKTDQRLPVVDLSDQLPDEINGWQKSKENVNYKPDNLFEYINGGAELYISYDFKFLETRTYIKESLPEIKVDIFHMGNSFNAFGVFSHGRETVDRFVGADVESEYAGGLLTFWKGPYYISILAYPETVEKKAVVKELACKLSGLIKEKSRKPGLIALLPNEKLIQESICYFKHHIWLNNHFYISDENILNIENGAEAVLAKYRFDKNSKAGVRLLLVSYPSKDAAELACKGFLKKYLPGATDGFKQINNQHWTGCRKIGRLVAVVFNADELVQLKDLLTKIRDLEIK